MAMNERPLALITGAVSGICRTIAVAHAYHGAEPRILGRSARRFEDHPRDLVSRTSHTISLELVANSTFSLQRFNREEG